MANYLPACNTGKPPVRGTYVVKDGLHCEMFHSGWNYRVWQSPETGQTEHRLWPNVVYVPQGDPDDPADADVWADPPIDQSGTLLEQERLEKKALLAREKSARRAKQTCRYKIKHAGFESLLTCTYRENMTDFDRVRRDWAAFMRKVGPLLDDWACVFAFEEQDRGSWHVHAAIRKLPVYLWVPEGRGRRARRVMVRSWDYLRRCWRGIVGQDNGNIDVDGHRKRRRGRSSDSLARLAGYVSKYLTKDHAAGPEGRNRWGSTQGLTPPKARVIKLPPMLLREAIDLAFHLPPGHVIVHHKLGRFGDSWMLYTEPDPGEKIGPEGPA